MIDGKLDGFLTVPAKSIHHEALFKALVTESKEINVLCVCIVIVIVLRCSQKGECPPTAHLGSVGT